MKNRIILMAAAIAAMAVSCQKEGMYDVPEGKESMVIKAGVATKTSLDGNDVVWNNGDQIAVFDNGEQGTQYTMNSPYTAENISGSRASFSGHVTEGTTHIYAVYPYDKAVSASSSTVTATIPNEQKAVGGTFDNNLNVSVASISKTPGTEATTGEFINVCGLVKFDLSSEDIVNASKVTLSSDSNIAGKVTFGCSDMENITVSDIQESSNKIILTPKSGQVFTSNTFWFVVVPGQLNGISVTVETSQGVIYAFDTDNKFIVNPGKFINLGDLNLKKRISAGTPVVAHTYDADGFLTGSEVRVPISFPEMDEASFGKMTFEATLYDYANGIGVLTNPDSYTKYFDLTFNEFDSETNTLIFKREDNPYIPQFVSRKNSIYSTTGYYIEVICKIGNNSFTLVPQSTALVIPKPFDDGVHTLNPVYNIHTSFDTYSDSSTKKSANSEKGYAIYATRETVNISSDILDSYSNLLSNPTLNFEGRESLSVSNGHARVKAKQFGEYNLQSITTSFDGKSQSTPKTGRYYVTGIPFDMTDYLDDSYWECIDGNDLEYSNQKFDLGKTNMGDETYAAMKFFLPSATNVDISIAGTVYSMSYNLSLISYKYATNQTRIYVVGTKVYEKSIGGGKATFRWQSIKDAVSYNNNGVSFSGEPSIKLGNNKQSLSNTELDLARNIYTQFSTYTVNYTL